MDGHHHLRGGGGLEEEVDCGVCGGALTLPFIDFPSWGTSSELEAGKAGNSPTVGSEEEAAMSPSRGQKQRRSRNEKRVGRVRNLLIFFAVGRISKKE